MTGPRSGEDPWLPEIVRAWRPAAWTPRIAEAVVLSELDHEISRVSFDAATGHSITALGRAGRDYNIVH